MSCSVIGLYVSASLFLQNPSRLAINPCRDSHSFFSLSFSFFIFYFIFYKKIPRSGCWEKPVVGHSVSVQEEMCQSAILVPVCRQLLLTRRQGNAGATEVWLWLPPFLLLSHYQTPISVSAYFFVSFSHAFIMLFSSWSQGPGPAFPVLVLFYFILFILAQEATQLWLCSFYVPQRKVS